MTLTISPALERELQDIAAESDIPVDELACQALHDFVVSRRELDGSVRAAEERADREGWLTSKDVLARIAKRFRAA